MPAGTRVSSALLAAVGALVLAAPALAADPVLDAASYPDTTTYNCHTDPIPIYPGQNLNLYGLTKTCPNAEQGQRARRPERLRRAARPPTAT